MAYFVVAAFLFILIGGIFLWFAFAYYRENAQYYANLKKAERLDLLALVPPGWLLLPLIPFYGRDALDSLFSQIHALSNLTFEIHSYERPASGKVELKGGDCILIGEQYDITGGEADGMRMEVLRSNRQFVSQKDNLHPTQIPVYTVRKTNRVWASIELQGGVFCIRPISSRGVVTILDRNGGSKILGRGRFHFLQSGDRIIIGANDYKFIQLPHLSLLDRHTGNILCENIEQERNWKPDDLSELRIQGGILVSQGDGKHKTFYPVPGGTNYHQEQIEVRLQPGDRTTLPDESEWIISYSVVQ